MVRPKPIIGRRPEVKFQHGTAKKTSKPSIAQHHALPETVSIERPRPSQSAPRQPLQRRPGIRLDALASTRLNLGTALGDGNCFYDSLMQLAGRQLARHLGMHEHDLEPADIRFHSASTLLAHLEICATDLERGMQLMSRYPHLQTIYELRKTSDRREDDAESLKFSSSKFCELLKIDRARYKDLRNKIPKAQLRLVCNLAGDRSYDNLANEFVAPVTTAAFPGLRLAVVTSEMTMRRLNSSIHGAGQQDPHLLFLDTEEQHYVPATPRSPIDWAQLQADCARAESPSSPLEPPEPASFPVESLKAASTPPRASKPAPAATRPSGPPPLSLSRLFPSRVIAAEPAPVRQPEAPPRGAATQQPTDDSLVEALQQMAGGRLAQLLGLQQRKVPSADIQRHVARQLVDGLLARPGTRALPPLPPMDDSEYPGQDGWQAFEHALGAETALRSLQLTPSQRRQVHALATGDTNDSAVHEMRPAAIAYAFPGLNMSVITPSGQEQVHGRGNGPRHEMCWVDGRYVALS